MEYIIMIDGTIAQDEAFPLAFFLYDTILASSV